MTCCVEDITFIGFKCKYPDEDKIPHKSWIHITAQIKVELQESTREKDRYCIRFPLHLQKSRKTNLFIFIGAECVGIFENLPCWQNAGRRFCLECNTMKENTGYLQNVRNIYNVSNKVSYCSMNGGNR